MGDMLKLWIRSGRAAKGLGQRELAEACGVGFPYISKIENGREFPSDDLLVRIAEVLDLDPDELLVVAGRVPQPLMDVLSDHPAEAVKALRDFAQNYRR
jgi:transcriptional regulator with XRE-family HTH domain